MTSGFHQITRVALAMALLAGGPLACATAGQRQDSFEDIQRKYTRHVRWSEYEEALEFVAEDERETYTERTEALGPMRVIDYRIDSIEFDPETNGAVVVVIYSAYRRSQPVAISVKEEQEWILEEETKSWQVSSRFEEKVFEAERRY